MGIENMGACYILCRLTTLILQNYGARVRKYAEQSGISKPNIVLLRYGHNMMHR